MALCSVKSTCGSCPSTRARTVTVFRTLNHAEAGQIDRHVIPRRRCDIYRDGWRQGRRGGHGCTVARQPDAANRSEHQQQPEAI